MDDDVVILVVGDESSSKSGVADTLAKLVGASELESTAAGVRRFTGASGKWEVVDTTPFVEFAEGSPLKNARQWISQNSLRRILIEKLVFLVCVVTSSIAYKPTKTDLSDMYTRCSWLRMLEIIFKENNAPMKLLVSTEYIAKDELNYVNQPMEHILCWPGFTAGKITYANLSTVTEGESAVKSIIEDSNRILRKIKQNSRGSKVPFLVKSVSDTPIRERFGPWGPERVILFGKTGSGKSTLAQMLTTGQLDPHSKLFPSSSSNRGETKAVTGGEGRGWYVVDTPGFGEPKDEHSTTPTREAEKKIKNFVKTIEGFYSHFLFVVHKDRIDELEVRLWKFFVLLFGEEIMSHFSVVVSNADSHWVEQNMTYLRQSFKGCESFLCAEFPSIMTDDEELENELQDIRLESLKKIENGLAKLSPKDTFCQLGEYSKTAILGRKTDSNQDTTVPGCSVKDIRQKAVGVAKRAYFEVSVNMSRLTNPVTVRDDVFLLPY